MCPEAEQIVSDEHPGVRAGVVRAAIDGDLDAVRSVWQANRRWVAAILLAHKPREADLEDLLQDVATTMVRTIGKLRDEGSIRAWLRTTAINAARAAGRTAGRRRRRFRLVGGPLEASSPTVVVEAVEPADGLAGREASRRLMELAMSLPEGYREPLLLRCVRGMSYRQISEVLGLAETTVETRITRGRRMLREMASRDAELADGVSAGGGRKA